MATFGGGEKGGKKKKERKKRITLVWLFFPPSIEVMSLRPHKLFLGGYININEQVRRPWLAGGSEATT